jgi:hypothetical protein
VGHRANYAIKEHGVTNLYYSHWGAKTVPADVFWGPPACEAFIRRAKPEKQWMDEADAEGGIALDKDSRRGMFFGEGELLGAPGIGDVYLRLARKVWSEFGWELLQGDEQGDLAEFCGIPRADVELPDLRPTPFPLSKIGENYAKGFSGALIAHYTDEGLTDRVLDFTLSGILLNGPAFLPYLRRLLTLDDVRAKTARGPTPEEELARTAHLRKLQAMRAIALASRAAQPQSIWQKLKRGFGAPDPATVLLSKAYVPPARPYNETIRSFAILDETRHKLAVHEWPSGRNERWISSAWPGWQVKRLERGVAGYFEGTGRAVPSDFGVTSTEEELAAEPVSFDEAVTEIERYLFAAEQNKGKLQKMTREMKEIHNAPGAVFAPGFSDAVPPVALSAEERRSVWLRALAAVKGSR